MRDHLVSLVQHCCKPPFWSQKSGHFVPTRHVFGWTSTSRNINRPDRVFPRPLLVRGVSELSGKQSNLGGVCPQALLGAGVTGLSRKQSDLSGVLRMTTTANASQTASVPEAKYMFGPWKIDAREVFLITEHCYCFVNLKPVVPGHVLVTTKKLVSRFRDLTAEEVADLWVTAQRVGQKLEPFYNGTSLTLSIQDGPEAGQTVPHVHVHILPRKKEDFEKNDEIYDELDKKEKELNEAKKEDGKHLNLDEERKDRSLEEMFEEASRLRALFQ